MPLYLIQVNEFLNSGFLFSSSGIGSHCTAETLWIAWGEPESSDQPLSDLLSVYAPDFFLEAERPWFCFRQFQKIQRSELVRQLHQWIQTNPSLGSSPLLWRGLNFDVFREAFIDLKKEFEVGRLIKAVPVVFDGCHWHFDLTARATVLENLLVQTQNVPYYLYGIWGKQEGILGATPELLFEQQQQANGSSVWRSMALAGTRLKSGAGEFLEIPLLEDPKERQEHQIVIDGICSAWAPWGQAMPGRTRELDLPTLSHLYTPIWLYADQDSKRLTFVEMVKTLHPTPALGAFPKVAGMEWLRDYEKRRLAPAMDNEFSYGSIREQGRARLGAPFGVLWPKGCSYELSASCVVSIRNLQWEKDQVRIGAGCGVVPASDLHREWQELQGKIHSVKSLLGIL